jgi:hypothetical protein
MSFKKVCLLLPVLALFVVSQASATLVTYTDQATFAAASTNLATVDYENLADEGSWITPALPYTNGGVTLSSNASDPNNQVAFVLNKAWGFTSGVTCVFDGTHAIPTLSVPTGTKALGVDLVYGDVETSGYSGFFTLSDGSTQPFALTLPASVGKNVNAFIGLTSSSTPITSVTINPESVGGTWIGAVSYQTPEPGTVVLLATGLIGLLAYAWRKRK